MKKTYTVTFGDTTATRTSENDYHWATCRKEYGSGWVIRFHQTHAAARRRAGINGTVKRTEVVGAQRNEAAEANMRRFRINAEAARMAKADGHDFFQVSAEEREAYRAAAREVVR